MQTSIVNLAEREHEHFVELHRMQDQAIRAARESERPKYEGAGIVIVAGGARCFTNAYVAVANLRNVVATQLPIQVWFLGNEEMSPTMMRIISKFDVELIDALEVQRRFPVRRLGGWECKVYAVLHSPFRHAVLLDADNIALVDPAHLLRLPEYQQTGTIFWPDNQTHPQLSPVWELFRVSYRHELEVESGQLLIDKDRCWVPLNLAQHFNEWSDIYYKYVYGDKETFHFAWRQIGQPYAMPAERPRMLYCYTETPYGRRRMTGALEHRDFTGRPVFHHRTGAEWVLYGKNAATVRSDLEAKCLSVLAELRQEWDGRVMRDPPIVPGLDGSNLIEVRRFRYRRIGVDERLVDLELDGRIGLGASPNEQMWRREDDADSQTVVLSGKEGDTCRLTMADDGIWRGAWLWYERMPVELVPVGMSSPVS